MLTTLIGALSGYAYSKHQTPQYEASAQVLLSGQPISSQINGSRALTPTELAQYVANETGRATSPQVEQAALKTLHEPQVAVSQFQKNGSVSGDSTAGVLTFVYHARTAAEARSAADAWANAYKSQAVAADQARVQTLLSPLLKQKKTAEQKIQQYQANNQIALANAQAQILKGVGDQIAALQNAASGIPSSRQYTAADTASKTRPKTSRNILAAAALGFIFGLIVIGLMEALDTRVRRSDEVGTLLGLQLLSRIPTPTRSMRRSGRLAMIDDQDPRYSEAYRRLRVNLDFANVRAGARTILLTSALEQEGKSTTVANLAVAMARAGRRVALVDLDLRRPILHSFFGLEGHPGITDIDPTGMGAGVTDALYNIPLQGVTGRLEVMPAGTRLPVSADFLESPVVDLAIQELANRSDVVLIDSAPLLPVSDSVALLPKVEGLLLVVPSTAKRTIISELHRTVASSQTPILGFILTAAEHETDGYYGTGYYYGGGTGQSPAERPRMPSLGEQARIDDRATGNGNGAAPDTVARPESSV